MEELTQAIMVHLHMSYLLPNRLRCGIHGDNHVLHGLELSHRFKLSRPKVVIIREDQLGGVQAACAENPDVDTKIFVLDAVS